ncbi:hypothetical protein OQA88_11951 [Cercophora sp. LCS_1]
MSGLTPEDWIENLEGWKLRAVLMAISKEYPARGQIEECIANIDGAAPGNVLCIECGKAYDRNRNHKKRCRTHTGELDDTDEECVDPFNGLDTLFSGKNLDKATAEGRANRNRLRMNSPRYFRWTCCGRKHNGLGCRLSRHRYRIDDDSNDTASEIGYSDGEFVRALEEDTDNDADIEDVDMRDANGEEDEEGQDGQETKN